jgi:hypothetical protein
MTTVTQKVRVFYKRGMLGEEVSHHDVPLREDTGGQIIWHGRDSARAARQVPIDGLPYSMPIEIAVDGVIVDDQKPRARSIAGRRAAGDHLPAHDSRRAGVSSRTRWSMRSSRTA